MRYHIVPLGCQMNQSDTERIRAVLESLGYVGTDVEEEADLLGVVACSVRQKAIDKVYSRIHKWNDWKKERGIMTFVSGCILPADREKFVDRFDLLFTINELPELPEMMEQNGIVTPASLRAADQRAGRREAAEYVAPASEHGAVPPAIAARDSARSADTVFGESDSRDATRAKTATDARTVSSTATIPIPIISAASKADSAKGYWKIAPDYTSSFEAFVPIQNGCDKFCTFCAVPYTRGREVSRPSEEILAEVESLVRQGYRSITLLGQNVNSYGLDRQSTREGSEIGFADLLRGIGKIGAQTDKRFWTYFTSPHPHDMSDDVIDVIAEYDVLARQIHLPIQSGDDKVLIRMNRNYRLSRYRKVVEKIRSTIPEASLFTDIIVGFTGETDEQFEGTREAMREFQYNMAYIAMYSPRPGAKSARWEDDVPHSEKRRRLHELSSELQRTSSVYNVALVGQEMSILVDGTDRKTGHLSGKTEGKLIVRFASDDRSLIGSFATVRITSASALSLEGDLIAPEPDTLSEASERTQRSRLAAREAFHRQAGLVPADV